MSADFNLTSITLSQCCAISFHLQFTQDVFKCFFFSDISYTDDQWVSSKTCIVSYAFSSGSLFCFTMRQPHCFIFVLPSCLHCQWLTTSGEQCLSRTAASSMVADPIWWTSRLCGTTLSSSEQSAWGWSCKLTEHASACKRMITSD